MKTVITIAAVLLLSAAARAEEPIFMDRGTIDNDRTRHSADRYEEYKENNYQAPLGGYTEKFGDSTPAGTISPGVASPQPFQPATGGNPYGNGLIGGGN